MPTQPGTWTAHLNPLSRDWLPPELVGLIPPGEVRPLIRGAGTLGDSLTLAILTTASVITVTLFVIKGTLDQLPGVLNSWRRAVRRCAGRPRTLKVRRSLQATTTETQQGESDANPVGQPAGDSLGAADETWPDAQG
ncbi:hypothetical protein GCM10014715_86760 [Streptomyces spiralis]|uniref:Uncharacterized protein n=1 Tax=Streptomyces spiralis TaxID=66376 RepID=A0A919E4C6_9ACTN|nr:hypothetical protein GCM10014715_86760 [Streptomyces spiralis]